MTIATRDDLKAAAATWAHRSDLTANLDDCITLAEARINDTVILRDMEQETTLTASVGSNSVALPSNYVSPIELWLTISGYRRPLTPALPEELPYYPNNSIPRYWAVDGDNVRFDCPSDSAYSLPFRYVGKSNLSASVTTNELLTKRPDLYLAGVMVEIAHLTLDNDMLGRWEPKFLKACAEVKAAESRARSMVPLRVDTGLVSRKSADYNIFTG